MKVILCILDGNGSKAGVAQLSELGVKDFAAEVARFVRANDIDGVMLDREYTGEPDLSYPYLSNRNPYNAARLYHELKTLMPDKLMLSYEFHETHTVSMENAYYSEAEGRPHVSEYIDISCADYGGRSDEIGGLTKADGAGVSLELNASVNRGGNLTTSVGERLINDGWGYWIGFNPYPPHYFTGSHPVITDRLQRGGIKAMYGSELKAPQFFYKKMSTVRSPYSEIGSY